MRVMAADEVAAVVARINRPDARSLLESYANEARVGFDLITPLLAPGMRVLEVGCGIGLLARFLADEGVDISGIEPGATGFGLMPEISAAILAMEPAHGVDKWAHVGAEALTPDKFGAFDLVYSTNVVEHIPNLDAAFAGMASVLAPDGLMVHACPNYLVPYEPHFGIPLIPGLPRATRFLAPSVLTRLPGVWDELNFITSGKVKTLARKHHLDLSFDRGVLAHALRRLDRDQVFRARQAGLASSAQRVIKRLGLLGLLERLPGEYATPMIFRMQPRAGQRTP